MRLHLVGPQPQLLDARSAQPQEAAPHSVRAVCGLAYHLQVMLTGQHASQAMPRVDLRAKVLGHAT